MHGTVSAALKEDLTHRRITWISLMDRRISNHSRDATRSKWTGICELIGFPPIQKFFHYFFFFYTSQALKDTSLYCKLFFLIGLIHRKHSLESSYF